MVPKSLNSASWLTVEQMMNRNIKILHVDDSLRTVVQSYLDYKLLNTLPVVDQDEHLIGVFPKKRLYKALLDGTGLDDPCTPYVVYDPVFVSSDLAYDEASLVMRVNRSRVDYVVVVEHSGKVVGMIGTAEYLKESLNVINTSSALLESLFRANYEGIIIVDNDGYILRINPAAEKMLGIDLSGAKGRRLKEILPELAIAGERRLGMKQTVRSVPVIVNQVPIIEDNQKIGTNITILDVSDMEIIAQEFSFPLRQQVKYYRNELEKRGEDGSFEQIVSINPNFNKLKKDAQRIARSSSTVLLTGESGVGKDMFARAIHAASPRARRPFVKVNCAAIPEALLESELFGYAPGSFTGASKKGKPGYFEQAQGGTIFLDEIGDMPLPIQVKLLQVLQEKQFIRVGGTGTQKVDVRIIAATNRDLRDAITRGVFREDIYYRLHVIEFRLPPLRDHSEDILPLAETFIEKYNHILGANVTGMNQAARDVLTQHDWPGNIRELENAVERAANWVWEGEIGTEHLPPELFPSVKKPLASYRTTLKEMDQEILLETLKRAGGNKSQAARLLNLSRSAFYYKLAKYGLH